VVEGDFNGDGKLDLAVGNYNSHTVSVLLGNGDGTFQSQQTFATSSGPYLAVGDFNGDGKLDLAVDNFDSANVGVLLGNGDGTFQSQQTFATGTGPLLLTVGDFNSDGKLDLAVANIHSNTVSVLVSNGDGTFQSQRTFATGLFPDSVAVGDFNGDGKLDLATADEGSHEVSALLNRAPTVTAVDAGGTYNGSPFPAIGSNVGVDGTTAVSGSYTFIYTNAADGSTSSSAPVNAGSYTVVAHFTSSDLTYSDANSGPTSFTIAQAPLIGSITAANKVDDGTTAATITSRTLTGVLPADLSNVSYVGGTATFADPFVGTGKTVTATGLSLSGSAASNYSVNTTATTTADITPLGITPASLSGTVFEDFNNDGQVDFGEEGISGVSITLTGTDDLGHAVNLSQTTDGDGAYIFQNLRPGSYTLTETQPAGFTQGINSIGSAGGTQALDQFFVQLAQGVDGLNYNFGERPVATGTVQQGQTAGIGFWNNKNGQALILALNGGTGHQLGDWLAATLVNLYGANSANDLAGTSNAYVAALFQKDFVKKGQKLDAQVLATALSVYATNATLDDTQVAAAYGFAVRGDGLGTATVNVGSSGGAFGVANNTTMTVLDLLLAADAQAVNGLLYNGIVTLRNEANNVFSALNQAGAIG